MEKLKHYALMYVTAFLMTLFFQVLLTTHTNISPSGQTVGYAAGFAIILSIVPGLFIYTGGKKSPWISLAALSAGALFYGSAFI